MPRQYPLKAALILSIIVVPLLSTPFPSTYADIITLEDGNVIEAKILSESDDSYEVKTVSGSEYSLPKSRVVSIRKKPFPPDIFEDKFAALADDDAEGAYELGVWAEEKKMRKLARKAFGRTIEIDPDHERTREKLGHVKFEGEWITEAKREAIIKERKAEAAKESEKKFAEKMRQAGYERYKGIWMPKANVAEIKKGKVRYRGEWVTPKVRARRTIQDAEGEVVEGRTPAEAATGLKLNTRRSPHFTISSAMSDQDNKQYLVMWEKTYRWYQAVFDIEAEDRPWEDRRLFAGEVFYFIPRLGKYAARILTDFLDWGHPESIRRLKEGGSLPYSTRRICLGSLARYEGEFEGLIRHDSLIPYTNHLVSHIVFNNTISCFNPPDWLYESIAIMAQLENTGKLGYTCRYKYDTGGSGSKDLSDFGKRDLIEMAKGVARGDGGTALGLLLARGLNSLSVDDFAKCYTILLMMMETDRKKFVEFCRGLGGVPDKDMFKKQKELLKALWEKTPAEFDKAWRKWILRG